MKSRGESLRLVVGVVATGVLLLLANGEALADAPWAPWTRVDDAYGAVQTGPRIATDPTGNSFSIWEDTRNYLDQYMGINGSDIYFSYRPAGGSWGQSIKINDNTGISWRSSPDIALDTQGNVYAIWWDGRNGSQGDIYFAYRPAEGSWGTNVEVSDGQSMPCTNEDNYSNCSAPRIAVDGRGNAYAVWMDGRAQHLAVYFSNRPSGGYWGPNIKVTDVSVPADGTAPSPASIAVDTAGNAHVMWSDSRSGNPDVYYAYRPNGGSWSPAVKVNDDPNEPGMQVQESPVIALDARGNAYAAWWDNRNGNIDRGVRYADVFFSIRSPGGDWTPNVRVNDSAARVTGGPAILADGWGNLWAAWTDWRNATGLLGGYYVDEYTSYRPAGGAWQPSTRLDQTGGSQKLTPSLSTDNRGNIYAIWTMRGAVRPIPAGQPNSVFSWASYYKRAGIDIRPGTSTNAIDPKGNGIIPVAVLSEPGFDAPAQMDRASLTFGRTGSETSLASCSNTLEDISGDGLRDLVCNFDTAATGFRAGDTEGILAGQTVSGVQFQARDQIVAISDLTHRVMIPIVQASRPG